MSAVKLSEMYLIEWLDPCSLNNEWSSLEELDELKPGLCRSLCWIRSDDGINLRIYAHIMFKDGEDDEYLVSGSVTIPCSLVVKKLKLDVVLE